VGYNDGALKAACGFCKAEVFWYSEPRPQLSGKWTCKGCGTRNILKTPPEWPNVPRELYIGHNNQHQVKLYPFPPDDPDAARTGAQPYCTRSFILQVSRRLGGCDYATDVRSRVMGQPVFADRCSEPAQDWASSDEDHECHMISGFTRGASSCALWAEVAALCQTDGERRFLRSYLELVKDRQFPMLIPQARIGIAERRRPDFVVFVPLHWWKYKRYAIQLDGAHPARLAQADYLRDLDVEHHDYEVISVGGTYRDVQLLVERIDSDMGAVKSNAFAVAVEVGVRRTEPAYPFF
jgi:hypothetical protein